MRGRGRGHVISVSPLWTLQCLSSGPDQMLRQLVLTAERTVTRAGDMMATLDGGAAIRERPPPRKGILVLMPLGRVQTCVRPVQRGTHGRWP